MAEFFRLNGTQWQINEHLTEYRRPWVDGMAHNEQPFDGMEALVWRNDTQWTTIWRNRRRWVDGMVSEGVDMSSYSQKNLCWQTTICHPNRGETRLSSPPCFYMVAKTPHTFLTFSNVKSWAQLHTWSCITTQDKLQCFLLHSEYNDVDITHTHTHTRTHTTI